MTILQKRKHTHHEIATQTVLQTAGEVLVEYGVEVVIVGAQVTIKVRRQAGVGLVHTLCVVVALPELDRSHIGYQEYCTA